MLFRPAGHQHRSVWSPTKTNKYYQLKAFSSSFAGTQTLIERVWGCCRQTTICVIWFGALAGDGIFLWFAFHWCRVVIITCFHSVRAPGIGDVFIRIKLRSLNINHWAISLLRKKSSNKEQFSRVLVRKWRVIARRPRVNRSCGQTITGLKKRAKREIAQRFS